jgi:hypothetical protein
MDNLLRMQTMISTNTWSKLVFEHGEEFDNRHIINMGDFSMYTWALIIAGTFTLFALCLSSHLLRSHLSSYNNPNEQKWLIGIILMVPVYSVTSVTELFTSLSYHFVFLLHTREMISVPGSQIT